MSAGLFKAPWMLVEDFHGSASQADPWKYHLENTDSWAHALEVLKPIRGGPENVHF